MSRTGKNNVGYPRSQQSEQGIFDDRVQGITILDFFGGIGGTSCPVSLDATQYVYSVKVSKFIVRNKSLTLFNPLYFGVEIYSDAGPDIICDHSFGSLQPWYLGLSADGVLTDAQVKAQGNVFNTVAPFNIEILENKLPQPGDANWENKIYIHIVWDDPTFVNGMPMRDNILEIAKHDYDIKI